MGNWTPASLRYPPVAAGRRLTGCMIGTPLIGGDSSNAQEQEVEPKSGGPLCRPSLFLLSQAPAPGQPLIDSCAINPEERLTSDLKLSPDRPRPLPSSPFAC